MTLMNELGIAELLKGITDNSLESAIIYIENNKISLLQFIGTLSLCAYTHNTYSKYYEKLKKILKSKFLNNIYAELENINPIFKNIENISSEEIQTLIDSQLSNKLIQQVAYTEQIKLQDNFSYWGVNYLFDFLLESDLSNFEDWIKTTKRIDFKVVFLNKIFSHNTNYNIIINNLDSSNLGIIQAFYALSRFNIEPHRTNVDLKEEDISLLFESSLSNRSKFIVYLKYITSKYHGRKLKEIEETEDIDSEFDKFIETKYDFKKEELFMGTGIYYSIICFKIIQRTEDKDKKQLLLQELLDCLLKYLYREKLIEHNIDYAKLLGLISVELKQFEKIEKVFYKEYKDLSFPYSFCKIKNWPERVCFMFYLLIGICIYKKSKGEDFGLYIAKFNFIKGDIDCHDFRNFNSYLE